MAEEKSPTTDELEQRWITLRTVLDKDGSAACIAAIRSEIDDSCRHQLFRFAIRKLGGGTGPTSAELDGMIAIGDAAIRDSMETADRHPAESARWQDGANIIAYNLSANLCDCWGDGDSRLKRHFEAGLRYADQGLELRRQLNKGPGPFSMAYWARGKHLLSLGRPAEAANAFREALNCEEELARQNGAALDSMDSAPGGWLNTRAFLGLSLLRAGDSTGQALFDDALTALRAQALHGEGEVKEDAQVYRDQVEESLKRN